MRTPSMLAAAALAAALLTSCSSEQTAATDPVATEPSASSSPAAPAESAAPATEAPASPEPASPEPAGQVLAITVDGDEVSPNGERLELAVGETLTLEIDSDRAGELHVHSRPEQYVNFEAGTSTQELVVERPGLVEMEDHDTGDVLAQIEVR